MIVAIRVYTLTSRTLSLVLMVKMILLYEAEHPFAILNFRKFFKCSSSLLESIAEYNFAGDLTKYTLVASAIGVVAFVLDEVICVCLY